MTPTKASSPETARIGVMSGRMIRKKIVAWPAPSIVAASSSERGIASKKPLMSHTWPSAKPHRTRM